MSDNSVTEMTTLSDAEVVSAMIKDPEIRKLPAGSDEFKVAVEQISAGKKAQEATAGAKGDDQASTDTEPQQKKKGLERRFSELTGERDAAKQRAAELEARLAALEAQAPSTKEPELVIQRDAFDVPKPTADKFDTYADYVEALTDWKADKRDFDKAQEAYVADVQKQQKAVVETWDSREKATKERVEGYDQLVDADFIKSFTTKIASKESMTYLLESDNGPDLLFELAEDDAKLAGFKSMSPVKQVAYLAKLEAKFEKTDTAAKTTVTKAPPPSKTLPKGKTAPARQIDPSGPMSFNDYQAWRKANSKK